MDATHDINYGDLYFGDDTAQSAAIVSLSAGLREKPGVHIVLGGQRSGKSTVIEETINGFSKDSSFVSVTPKNAQTYFDTEELSELKNALLKLTEKKKMDFDNDTGDFKLFESNSTNPHEVLFISAELILPNHAEQLRAVMNVLQSLPSTIAPLSIVFDAPNPLEPLLPGTWALSKKKKCELSERCVEELCQEYPDLSIHRTTYNREQIKEALWLAREEGTPVNIIQKYLEVFNVDIKHPAIMDVSRTLKEKDRAKYDIAFERIPLAEVRR